MSWNFRQAYSFREKLHKKIKQTKSPNRKIKIYPDLVTYVGKTTEEVLAKKGELDEKLEIIDDTDPSLRELLGYLTAGGGHLTLIGTPKEIVDQIDIWFNEGFADGFNLISLSLPAS